jgi:hypothetical protein
MGMKLKAALAFILLCPMASHAFMRAPIQLPTDKVDCGNRSNSMVGQMNDLQGLVHRVGLVGGETGRVVSDDPSSIEAKIAEASGTARFCGKSVGTLNLIEHNGRHYLIGNSHSFYEDGALKCGDLEGKIYPDLHHSSSNQNIDRKRGYSFKLPPLNHETALKFATGKTDQKKINDLVVLEITDSSLLASQSGGNRKAIKMVDTASENLKDMSNATDVIIISKRQNFDSFKTASVENNCRVNNFVENGVVSKLKKHSCDTGGGSSGASLNFLDSQNNLHSLGIHYGGRDSTAEDFADETSEEGNFFIPSSQVIEVLDNLENKNSDTI